MNEFWKSIPHDMFDFADYYDHVAKALPSNCNIAEVGVADGASSLYLAAKMLDENKSFYLRMIDSLDYGHVNQMKTIMDNVMQSGLSKFIDLVPLDSLNATLKFPDNYFDMVFLDSGHTYELTKAEIRLWIRKIKDGGILAGHDIFSNENSGVNEAVEEVLRDYPGLTFHETSKGYGVWEIKKQHQETPL